MNEYALLVLSLLAVIAFVLHKRILFQPRHGLTPMRQFLFVVCSHFVPASVAWSIACIAAFRVWPIPAPGLVTAIGVFGLAQLLTQRELMALKRNAQ